MHKLKEIANALPLNPGCYIFKDEDGQILYVGKSKCLKKRVATYFGKQKDEKIAQLMHFAADLSYQCVGTDIEALLLEYCLIKQYRPPYNAKMRKDRQYWYINIEEPKILISQEKGSISAGPFPRKEYAWDALSQLGDYWPIPTCEAKRKGPCLRFHIKQCLAPCTSDTGGYKELAAFFKGDFSVLKKLNTLINKAVKEMAFEKAAHLQNQYENLRELSKHIEKMPPDLKGKNYYISLKSRHDSSFMWVYMQDFCVRAWMTFPNGAFVVFEHEEGSRLANAVLEIEALRGFVEDLKNFIVKVD